jgi:hypothetical protein
VLLGTAMLQEGSGDGQLQGGSAQDSFDTQTSRPAREMVQVVVVAPADLSVVGPSFTIDFEVSVLCQHEP